MAVNVGSIRRSQILNKVQSVVDFFLAKSIGYSTREGWTSERREASAQKSANTLFTSTVLYYYNNILAESRFQRHDHRQSR